MLRTATRVAAMPVRKNVSKQTEELAEAHDLLMSGQCNDAFWHGVFGGLYAPHLRTAIWKNLIRAEWLADRQVPGGLLSRVEMLDYDADGANELLFTSPDCQAMLPTKDGDVPFSVTKRFSFGATQSGCEVACEIGIKLKQPLERAVMIGIESVINLLAPNDADRFFETPEGPQPLRFSGVLSGPIMRMEDGWHRVRIS